MLKATVTRAPGVPEGPQVPAIPAECCRQASRCRCAASAQAPLRCPLPIRPVDELFDGELHLTVSSACGKEGASPLAHPASAQKLSKVKNSSFDTSATKAVAEGPQLPKPTPHGSRHLPLAARIQKPEDRLPRRSRTGLLDAQSALHAFPPSSAASHHGRGTFGTS